ncbi:hypothetical protein P879_10886 [Paragonimus westermani]|uniref:Uncharacterized protein n=1 Tax=Paragonimus westermani TaxID=34504 RepID=A0A8T0D8J2_9TREM|nr:hypothetical protein P879_10886 [Paragonimus westermani]
MSTLLPFDVYPVNCLFPTTARIQLAKCFAGESSCIRFMQFIQLGFASVYVKQLLMRKLTVVHSFPICMHASRF